MSEHLTRRALLKMMAGTLLLGALPASGEPFTGPGPNPNWNSVGPYVQVPQKVPLLRLTDRPVQLETPRAWFAQPFTPNEAFYVRWHLDEVPAEVDLATWRLSVDGLVEQPLKLSLADLMRFPPVTVAAVNQCSGNSRSRLQPRVPGGQWGNGAMGNALWTGARVRDVVKLKAGAVQVQFQGMEHGKGPPGHGSHDFMKSLDVADLDDCIIAWAMNGAPLPLQNGFPVRLVAPGFFATYWMKGLSAIRVLDHVDDNYWMKSAYRIPDTPRGNTTPAEASKVATVPIHRMPVRSFIVLPDETEKVPAGMAVRIMGLAFSGHGRVTRMEWSDDDGKTWRDATLGEDHGPWSFRMWEASWTPAAPGRYSLACRATDEKGNVQPDEPVWNPGGYMWNRIERQAVVVGGAS